MSCDYKDYNSFYEWWEVRSLFNIEDANLCSLLTGVASVAGKDPVDCEYAKTLGIRIQKVLITIHSMRLRLNERRNLLL